MNARDELIEAVLPVLEECFDSDWNMTYSEMVTDALIIAGYRKIFDGDCGLSSVKDPTDREASEAWMRWANLVSGNGHDGIAAMKQMLTEFGYRKPSVIITVEELDALPVGSILLDVDGDACQRFRGGWRATVNESNDDPWLSDTLEVDLPATVLHEPEATK